MWSLNIIANKNWHQFRKRNVSVGRWSQAERVKMTTWTRCTPNVEFTEWVRRPANALAGLLSTEVLRNTEADGTGKMGKTNEKPLPGKGSDLATGRRHVTCWFFLLSACDEQVKLRDVTHRGRRGRYRHVIRHPFFCLSCVAADEPQLVNARLAIAMLLSLQACWDLCMQLPCERETQGKQRPVLCSMHLSTVQPDMI